MLIDDSGNAVLCDFGLARIKADVTDRIMISNSEECDLFGSLNWMAPEILLGWSAGKESDIYALAMVLYEVSVITTTSRYQSLME